MLTKLKEFVKTKITKERDEIKHKLHQRKLKKLDPDLYCSVCKQTIKRGEFIAVMGKNTLVPALYAGGVSRSYGWLLGCKKYCEKCFSKEFRK